MEPLKLLPPILLLVIATSAEALEGRDCLDQSNQLKAKERASFLTACLTRASSPASTLTTARQEKALRCSENAKNLALTWDQMNDYIKTCLTRNEAAEAAARMAAPRDATKLAATTKKNSAHQ